MLGDANNPQILSPIETGGGSGFLTKSQADTYYYPLSTNPAGYLTGLTVGTTPIASGTDGYVLWQQSGKLAEIIASYVNTNNSIVLRDSAGNAAFNNVVRTVTQVNSANQTIAMTYGSSFGQETYGTSNVTFNLPDATYLYQGEAFEFNNNSTGIITIYKHDGTTLVGIVISMGYGKVICDNNSTVNGEWDIHFYIPSGASSQFLKGDGSLDSSTYLSTVSVDGVTITGDGTPGNPLVGSGGTSLWQTGIYAADIISPLPATDRVAIDPTGTLVDDGTSALQVNGVLLAGGASATTNQIGHFQSDSYDGTGIAVTDLNDVGWYMGYDPNGIISPAAGSFIFNLINVGTAFSIDTNFVTTFAARMLVNGATDDTTSALQVNGAISSAGSISYLDLNNTGDGGEDMQIYSLNSSNSQGGNSLLFYNATQDHNLMQIIDDTSTRVLIANPTDDGTSALQVNGDIKDYDQSGATGIILYDTTLSQYVRYTSVAGSLVGTPI